MDLLLDRLVAHSRAASQTTIAHRQALHRIPELAYHEFKTAQYVADALRAIGLTPQVGYAGTTAVIAEFGDAQRGPCVMLRADMDALPIEQSAQHALRSEHSGRMHACGHDGHMAIALGAASCLMQAVRDRSLPGRIVLVFQPAEEAGGGAKRLIDAGLFEQFGIDVVLGLHLWSYTPRGVAIVPDGTVMASADEFRITLEGKGGHGALPHMAQDVVVALAQLVTMLQTIVSRSIDPLQPAVVTIGRLDAGSAPNVLPQSAMLHGTYRAPNPALRQVIAERIESITHGVAAAYGLRGQITTEDGYPPTVNHPPVARQLREAAAAVLGEGQVLTGPPTMAAEDFSFYLEKRPGAFMLLGMRDEQAGIVHPHHSAQFEVNDAVLVTGVEILLRAAAALLGERNLAHR
jgi:amidohydrolase